MKNDVEIIEHAHNKSKNRANDNFALHLRFEDILKLMKESKMEMLKDIKTQMDRCHPEYHYEIIDEEIDQLENPGC